MKRRVRARHLAPPRLAPGLALRCARALCVPGVASRRRSRAPPCRRCQLGRAAAARGGGLAGLADPHRGRAMSATSADPTGGNVDYRIVAPGSSITILDHRGAGIVRASPRFRSAGMPSISAPSTWPYPLPFPRRAPTWRRPWSCSTSGSHAPHSSTSPPPAGWPYRADTGDTGPTPGWGPGPATGARRRTGARLRESRRGASRADRACGRDARGRRTQPSHGREGSVRGTATRATSAW